MSDTQPRGHEGPPGWQSVGGVVERLTFGTADQDAIDQAIGGFALRYLGSGAKGVLFRSCSSHVVYGIELEDGRRAVIKALAAASSDALIGSQAVQRHHYAHGFPCPEPLVGPRPLGRGVAIAERLLTDGEMADTHEPRTRRLVAETLAWHLELASGLSAAVGVAEGWNFAAADRLWPTRAHSAAIDFHAPVEGSEWLDRLAVLAQSAGQRTLKSDEALLPGHHDWSGKHFRFADGRVTAVYDWDSVVLGREAVIVGNAAMTHTANFDLPGVAVAPTPEEVSAFIDDYSQARWAPLGGGEREAIAAAATYLGAYSARCELVAGGAVASPGSFAAAMQAAGERYLAV